MLCLRLSTSKQAAWGSVYTNLIVTLTLNFTLTCSSDPNVTLALTTTVNLTLTLTLNPILTLTITQFSDCIHFNIKAEL